MPSTETQSLVDLCWDIHNDNVAAGWWTDLTTGASLLASRNRPEMLMLAVTELAEALEGDMGQADDKLPHLPMYDVELGDFVIRQMDQIGAEMSLGASAPVFGIAGSYGIGFLRSASRPERLMVLVRAVSDAMEHYRKGRSGDYISSMAEGVCMAFAIADIERIDLLDVIAQKRAFNATRADHRPENRRLADGKKV